MGWMELLSKLVTRPVAFPKISMLFFTARRSSRFGAIKMAASSAYSEVLSFIEASGKSMRMPFEAAKLRIRCSGSMARMKSMGDKGSP
jgi:hypothetical protein